MSSRGEASREAGPLHVIVGAGPLGLAVSRRLARRGIRPRRVSRHGRPVPGHDADHRASDVSNPGAAIRALEGAAVVYHCAQPAYARWPQRAPALTHGILEGAVAAGASLVYGDNLYACGRAPMPLVETHPHAPVGPNTRTRARVATTLLDAHQKGRLPVTILRSSDFYGPFVRVSSMGARVFERTSKGKAAQLLGNPDVPHTYTFIEDGAEAMVILGESAEAVGGVWHAPSGMTRTTRGFVELIYRRLGRKPALSVAPRVVMRLLGVFDPTVRALNEVAYQREGPWVMDTSKFESTFGDIATPHEEAIDATLAWYSAAGTA